MLNMTKFRGISDQLLVLRRAAEKLELVANSPSIDPSLLQYWNTVEAVGDAELTRLRAAIIPVSKFRETAKTTSLEQFSGELLAALSAVDRRTVKWRQIAVLLESNIESVRLRASVFVVCPRDALIEGGLVGSLVRALTTKMTDIEYLSSEYMSMRRVLQCASPHRQLEDILLSYGALVSLAAECLPASVELLVLSLSDFLANKLVLSSVHQAIRALQQAAALTLAELQDSIEQFTGQLLKLKKADGALARKEKLTQVGSGDQATIRAVKHQQTGVMDGTRLREAQLGNRTFLVEFEFVFNANLFFPLLFSFPLFRAL